MEASSTLNQLAWNQLGINLQTHKGWLVPPSPPPPKSRVLFRVVDHLMYSQTRFNIVSCPGLQFVQVRSSSVCVSGLEAKETIWGVYAHGLSPST